MGVAAMLKNQWGDPGFAIGSLSDRTPFQEEDDIIVFAAPDPQGLDCSDTASMPVIAAGKMLSAIFILWLRCRHALPCLQAWPRHVASLQRRLRRRLSCSIRG